MHPTRIWPDLACHSNKMELHPLFTPGSGPTIAINQDPLPSVNDILDIAENESKENFIFIGQAELIG
jgi:hypothetical protein